MPWVTEEQIARAKQVDLLDYLLANEPHNLKKTGHEYHLRDHDSLTVSNGKWHWHSRGFGGTTALNYLVKVRGMEFTEAVQTLAYDVRAGPPPPIPASTAKPLPPKKAKPFALPAKNVNNDRAIAYLLGRGIDRDILKRCVEAGTLYEGRKYHNCVFVGQKDKHGKVRFACVRGTTSGFRQDMEGSDKRFGFLLPACAPPGEIVMVAEAPIDTLSMATLQKRKDAGWEGRHYLSLGGVSPLALLQFLQQHPQVNHIVLGLDNDKAGLEAIEKIKAAVYEDEMLRDRTLCITVSPPPAGKDYNDTLLVAIREQKEQEQRSRPNRAALSI
ncbi:MAG: toprim domain-containing protein [Bacillota bacterium]